MSYVKIGVGGPVGSGKTALIERLTRIMSKAQKMTTEHMIFGGTRCCEGIGIRVLGNQGDQIFQFFQKIADEV